MGRGCTSGLCVLSLRVGLKEGQKGEGVPFRNPWANEEARPLCFPFLRPVREGG